MTQSLHLQCDILVISSLCWQLYRCYAAGLRWWLPLSRLEGFTGVAEAASRLWENTVLLSGLMCSLSGYAVLFPADKVITSDWAIVYSTLWTLAFGFTLTAVGAVQVESSRHIACNHAVSTPEPIK